MYEWNSIRSRRKIASSLVLKSVSNACKSYIRCTARQRYAVFSAEIVTNTKNIAETVSNLRYMVFR